MAASYQPDGSWAFQRAWSIAITQGKEAALPDGILPGGSRAAFMFGTEMDPPAPLHVTFDIDSDVGGKPNTAKIGLFNLTSAHRNYVGLGSYVELRAGYTGNVGLVFAGHVAKATTERNGPDIVTSLECGDGEPMIAYGFVHLSYTRPVTLAQVLTDVAKAMSVTFTGLVCTLKPGIVKGLPNKVFSRGIAISSSCRDALDKLLHPLHLDWYILYGALTILPRGIPRVAQAVVLSRDTGLINTPSKSETTTTISSLMNAQLVPGALVQLQAQNKQLSGYYSIRKASIKGDTHGSPWNVDLECTQPDTPFKVLPAAVGQFLQSAVTG